MTQLRATCLSLLLLLVAIGCGEEPDYATKVQSPSLAEFTNVAYPVLLRDCAFSECHGAEHRFFQVYGPGRTRLDPVTTLPSDPVTSAEVMVSYERARSMLGMSPSPEESLLLRKPLEIAAGGQGHEGVDELGRNVYRSRNDPRYLALLQWAKSSAVTLPVGTSP